MMRTMTIATVTTLLAAIQAVAAPAGDKTPSPLSDKQIERRIAAHRTSEVVLTVTDSAGKPLANTPVTIAQMRHKFLFGANAFKAGRFAEAKHDAAYKQRILEEADGCNQPGELGQLLRREGLYSSLLSTWRRQRDEGTLAGLTPKRRGRKANPDAPLIAENERLKRETQRLAAKLRQAETIIEVQKKLSEMLGIPLPPSDNSGSEP